MPTLRREQVTGPARALHEWNPPDEPVATVRRCRAERAAAVLGSRQSEALLDPEAIARAGLEVARRASGGGIVLVDDSISVWVDVWLPSGASSVTADVRASMETVGSSWLAALTEVEPALIGRLSVHEGAVSTGAWQDLICFAGVGPGEVLLDGRKLVGLSQRRTRDWSRVQCQVHTGPASVPVADLLAPAHRPEGPAPGDAAWLSAGVVEAAADALADELADRLTGI